MINGLLILISFGLKSKFNPRKTDAAIDLYLSYVEEQLLSWSEIKHTFLQLN